MALYAGSSSWGSNTAFKIVRDAIADAMGVSRSERWDPLMTNDTLMGYWHDPRDSVFLPVVEPEDDIDFLMLHQDCEGILPWFTIRRLVIRLEEIVPLIPEDGHACPTWPGNNPRLLADNLIAFLRKADENGEMVVFSG